MPVRFSFQTTPWRRFVAERAHEFGIAEPHADALHVFDELLGRILDALFFLHRRARYGHHPARERGVAAHKRHLLDDFDFGARLKGGKGRRRARKARSDDEHVYRAIERRSRGAFCVKACGRSRPCRETRPDGSDDAERSATKQFSSLHDSSPLVQLSARARRATAVGLAFDHFRHGLSGGKRRGERRGTRSGFDTVLIVRRRPPILRPTPWSAFDGPRSARCPCRSVRICARFSLVPCNTPAH